MEYAISLDTSLASSRSSIPAEGLTVMFMFVGEGEVGEFCPDNGKLLP
jgi:hypothetical protein